MDNRIDEAAKYIKNRMDFLEEENSKYRIRFYKVKDSNSRDDEVEKFICMETINENQTKINELKIIYDMIYS